MPCRRAAGATVTIVGGNAVVGQALELLLQGLGYRARFEAGNGFTDPAGVLGDADLVVLAPGLSAERRAAILAQALEMRSGGRVPVLELSAGTAPGHGGPQVRWPCRAEELASAIDAALSPNLCGGRA